MGYFTFTLANRQQKIERDGDYARSCVLGYGSYGAILCPDGTLIKEPCYEGYGVFDGKDVYELVVDWNRDHLLEIPKLPDFKEWGCYTDRHKAALKAYSEHDDAAFKKAIADLAAFGDEPAMRGVPFSEQVREWKRTTGIYIACSNNALLPYPIKIVNCRKRPRPYSFYPASDSTQ